VISAAGKLPAFSNPMEKFEYASQQVSLIIGGGNTNNNNTAREEASEVMRSVINEDGSDNADLTQTPADVLALMEAAEKTIADETVKGKTSEECYSGGERLSLLGIRKYKAKSRPIFMSRILRLCCRQRRI
jgi:hypothetical protein